MSILSEGLSYTLLSYVRLKHSRNSEYECISPMNATVVCECNGGLWMQRVDCEATLWFREYNYGHNVCYHDLRSFFLK